MSFTFIAVGRLVKIKQFDKIILAFTKCFRGKKVQLKIIGDGKEYRTLKKLILNLEMQNQIILTGYLKKSGVFPQVITEKTKYSTKTGIYRSSIPGGAVLL